MTSLELKNVLCPIDLSAASDATLRWAGLFARMFKVTIEVLYADWWEPPRYFTEAQIQELSLQEQEGEKALRSQLEELAKSRLENLAPYTVAVVEGHPTQKILERAKQLMPGLIVMGSHGRTGMARLRLGSVAEDVVRESVCPVLIVKSRKDPEATPAINNILCPINFTSLSRQCLELSSELARAFGAKLWVVHATGHREANVEEIHKRLCDQVRLEVQGRCATEEIVRRGDASEQILLLAREHAADLIVMGAEHRPFLESTTLGTTTERVMRHSLPSVLVVPTRKSQGEI